MNADRRPSVLSSSSVDGLEAPARAGQGTATSEQRWSPPGCAHLPRRGSLDWTALEAAANKSSTSASAGGDASRKLQITETIGVVRHVKQAR